MNNEVLRKKILGGWLGKSVGGTLGQPYEGSFGPMELTFYDPVPTQMIPNDDLDLQILCAWALRREEKPVIDRNFFAELWMNHVRFCYDEYGVALRNFNYGIFPPASGSYDNYFTDGLGAAIRSEIWAALAPGDPALAAAYMYEDACLDHAGDGIYAAQFLAALESKAFESSDLDELFDAGLSVIPAESKTAEMVKNVRNWCKECSDPLAIRAKIIEKYGSDNFTDCVMNTGFSIMALILGKGDFGKSICLAVNCGYDTDCSGATVGAILGIANPDSIPEKWLAPIGNDCVVSDPIIDIEPPATLDELADWIIEIKERLPEKFQPGVQRPYETMPLTAECCFGKQFFALDFRKFNQKFDEIGEKFIRQFPGHKASFPAAEMPVDSILLMKFKFELAEDKMADILFNSPENTRVWVDGKFCFGREGGIMLPALHRTPLNQSQSLMLDKGVHEIVVGISRWTKAEKLEWVMAVADSKTKLYLTREEITWL